jgi:hypothetical protein
MHTKPAHRAHHHRPIALRTTLSRRHRRWLYLCSVLLFATGSGWLIAHYGLRAPDLAADGLPQPSEAWWLRLHGAAQLGFLIAFGALLPEHILHGWRQRVNVSSGVVVISVVIALTLTGYGLYYASGDRLRQWVSVMHWSIGLASAALLVWHIVRGRSLRQERSRA